MRYVLEDGNNEIQKRYRFFLSYNTNDLITSPTNAKYFDSLQEAAAYREKQADIQVRKPVWSCGIYVPGVRIKDLIIGRIK
jgi:hypothetical protein